MNAASVPYEQRKVVDNVFDGLFNKALKGQVTPRLQRRLADLGVHLDRKLEPIYPHVMWLNALTAAAEELRPGVPLETAFEQLGATVVTGYFETFIGAALKGMLRLMGVKRVLGRMTQNFAGSNNYTQTKLTELAPNHMQLWMNELSLTQHNATGILQAGLTILGGKGVKVQIVQSDAEGCTYDVRWVV